MSAIAPGRVRTGLGPWGAVATAALIGALLGALGIAVDQVSFPGVRLLIVFSSSGLSWGVAAVAAGAISRFLAIAPVAGALALLGGVLVYYGGIHIAGLRDSAGSSTLVHTALVWGGLAVVGGAVAGTAGWHARFGGPISRPVAWGVLAGMLWGQGLRWTIRYGLQLDVVFTAALILPLVIFAWGIRRGGARYGIPALLVTGALSVSVWALVEARV